MVVVVVATTEIVVVEVVQVVLEIVEEHGEGGTITPVGDVLPVKTPNICIMRALLQGRTPASTTPPSHSLSLLRLLTLLSCIFTLLPGIFTKPFYWFVTSQLYCKTVLQIFLKLFIFLHLIEIISIFPLIHSQFEL